MTYGLKVLARDGSTIQVDSDENGFHGYVNTYATNASNFLMLRDDWTYGGVNIFARRSPSSGYWKTLVIGMQASPNWFISGWTQTAVNLVFDGGSGGEVNTSSNRIDITSTYGQGLFIYMQNGDYVKYTNLNTSYTNVGGLTNGDTYVITNLRGSPYFDFQLQTLSGTTVTLGLSNNTSSSGHRFEYGGYRFVFYGSDGTSSNTSYYSPGYVYDVTYFASIKTGSTSFDTSTGNYGLQIKNSSNDIVFDSRNYTSNTVIYPSVIIQPNTRTGAPGSDTPLTTDRFLYPRVYNSTGTTAMAGTYDPSGSSTVGGYNTIGYIFYNNHSSWGSGIKYIGRFNSTFGGGTSFVANYFGNYLAGATGL